MRVESTFNKIGYCIFVVKWIAVFILYRIGKTSKDLWGWSCDDRAKKIQQYYVVQLDFQRLCMEQVSSLLEAYAHYEVTLTYSTDHCLVFIDFGDGDQSASGDHGVLAWT